MNTKKDRKRKKSAKASDSTFPHRLFALLIFFSAFMLYANTISHDYALDDDIYTKKNIFVQQGFSAITDIFNKGSLVGFNGVEDSQYRPVALLNFMIETSLFGLNPHVSHFFNVLLYSVTCVLIYFLLMKMLKNYNPFVPFIATVLFTFHPVHTEVVANIKSRDEILGLLFAVASLYQLMIYSSGQRKKNLFLSVFFYFIASISKENSLMFVFIAPLVLHFFTEQKKKDILITSLCFGGALLLYMAIRNSVLSSITIQQKLIILNNALEAAGTIAERYATNFLMLGKYLWLLIFPHPLSWDYSYNQIPIVDFTNAWAILSLLLYLAMGVFAVWKFKEKNIHSFTILFYFLTLFLASNLVIKIGATIGERFLYAPSLAFCISVSVLLFSLFSGRYLGGSLPKIPSGIHAALAIVLLLYTVKLVSRNRDWKNNYTLFLSGIETAPNSARAHNALASEYRTQAESSPDQHQRREYFLKSIEEYKKGISIYEPDPDAYYNLGVSYYGLGDTANAIANYTKTLSLHKGFVMALNNKGVIYFNQRKFDSAMYYFSAILKYDKKFADAYANIGAVYQNSGQTEKAIAYYEEIIRQGLASATLYNNLSRIYAAKGDPEKAGYYAGLAQGSGRVN